MGKLNGFYVIFSKVSASIQPSARDDRGASVCSGRLPLQPPAKRLGHSVELCPGAMGVPTTRRSQTQRLKWLLDWQGKHSN